jgi:hypothetical protein
VAGLPKPTSAIAFAAAVTRLLGLLTGFVLSTLLLLTGLLPALLLLTRLLLAALLTGILRVLIGHDVLQWSRPEDQNL